jgi:hypothetical protein
MSDVPVRSTLTIYRRPGCHLCDDAEVLLRDELAVRARSGLPGVTLIHVDISTDPELEARYGRRIPVFVIGDHEAALVTSTTQVRTLLDRALPRFM